MVPLNYSSGKHIVLFFLYYNYIVLFAVYKLLYFLLIIHEVHHHFK